MKSWRMRLTKQRIVMLTLKRKTMHFTHLLFLNFCFYVPPMSINSITYHITSSTTKIIKNWYITIYFTFSKSLDLIMFISMNMTLDTTNKENLVINKYYNVLYIICLCVYMCADSKG